MVKPGSPSKILGILAVTQIVSWGSLYYAFAILAPDMQREFGWRAEIIFGAFSWSLLVSGLLSTPIGILIDRFGGRAVMGSGSLLCGAGFVALGFAQSVAHYFIVWTMLGAGMGMVLYEAAFATINREVLHQTRQGISTVTLVGGLASTVFWPLTLKLNGVLGWRDTWLVYGAIQLLLCAPLHALIPTSRHPTASSRPAASVDSHTLNQAIRSPVFWKLAFAFSANSFVFSALSVHLIPMLQQFGHSAVVTVFLAALIGPLQVIGRIGEMVFAHRTLPHTVGKFTFAALPAALLALLLLGQHAWAVALFCMLYGLSNGILTIVRGTVPQALFGRENYGAIAGAMAGPSLISKAAGPLAVAALIQFDPSPNSLLGVLLAMSVISLWFYLTAVKAAPANVRVAPL
jgi:MFS family permease